jgi:rhodanese-related sulfurtransferase
MPLNLISPIEAKKLLDENKAIIIDVREPAEYESECIKDAKLIPVAEICKEKLPNTKGKKIIIHCRGGKRGGTACEKLLSEDASLEIYNIEGGISAWASSGLPTQKGGRNILPLDRQVQLTIGLSVLLGSLLAYFVDINFIIIPAFFGSGLIFAALTGTCALGLVIAKMPWNKSKEAVSFCSIKK